jgi:hypothetical protein
MKFNTNDYIICFGDIRVDVDSLQPLLMFYEVCLAYIQTFSKPSKILF